MLPSIAGATAGGEPSSLVATPTAMMIAAIASAASAAKSGCCRNHRRTRCLCQPPPSGERSSSPAPARVAAPDPPPPSDEPPCVELAIRRASPASASVRCSCPGCSAATAASSRGDSSGRRCRRSGSGFEPPSGGAGSLSCSELSASDCVSELRDLEASISALDGMYPRSSVSPWTSPEAGGPTRSDASLLASASRAVSSTAMSPVGIMRTFAAERLLASSRIN